MKKSRSTLFVTAALAKIGGRIQPIVGTAPFPGAHNHCDGWVIKLKP